jgi:two-component system, OmpR family, KDP operon response regulator KdpE
MMLGFAKPERSAIISRHGAEKPIGRVLVADEDYSVRRALHATLLAEGFDVTEASGMDEALALAQAVHCDVAMLAVHLSGRQALDVFKALRASCPALRILMLTSEDNERDQVEALDAGADDCLTKPLRMSEVMARVRATMRRATPPLISATATLRIGEIEANLSRRVVHRSGRIVHLTPKEFELLAYLMTHAGIPIPHRQILTAIWGQDHAGRVDYLRTFVRQLRKKLEDNASAPRYLLTNNYVGYRFVDHNELPAGC